MQVLPLSSRNCRSLQDRQLVGRPELQVKQVGWQASHRDVDELKKVPPTQLHCRFSRLKFGWQTSHFVDSLHDAQPTEHGEQELSEK